MSRVCVLPHRTTVDGIHAGPWSLVIGGEAVSTRADTHAWDHDAALELRSEVAIDPEIVRTQCQLADEDPLLLVTTWSCPATRTRGVGSQVAIDDPRPRAVDVVVAPDRIEGQLHLTRALVLGRATSRREPAVARRRGSILWRESPNESHTVDVGPPTARLSSDVVDFDHVPEVEGGAAWELQTQLADLDASAGTALRLLVNARHPAIDSILQEDDASPLFRSVLRWDVARGLVLAALEHESFVDDPGPWAPDSAGAALQALFDRCFPDVPLAELRRSHLANPGRIESMLQARLRFLSER